MTAGIRDASHAAAAAGAALVTLFACLAVIHTTPADAYWAGDCASRALLAERLLQGEVHLDYPARALDPEGRAWPLPDLAFAHDGAHASIFPVAYAALAAPALAAGGPAALRWPAALGSAACAGLFALWLAPWLGARAACVAGLALGLATPLFFYGAVVWEHSLCVALVLAACVLTTRPSARRLAGAGAALGLACWLREELVLAALMFAVACAWAWRRAPFALAPLAGALPPLLALVAWNALVYGTPLGPHTAALDPGPAWASGGALPRRIAALVAAYGTSEAEALALAGVGALAVAAGAVAEWRGRSRLALLVAASLGLGVWALMQWRGAALPPLLALVSYNGWLAQLPAASLAGIGAVRLARGASLRPLRPGIAGALGFLVLATTAGLLTQSVFGTGLHAGPRLLLPALPGLAALALLAVRDADRRRDLVALGVALAMIAAGGVSSARTVRLLVQQQREIDALQRQIRARPEPVLVSGDAMLTQLLAGVWHEKPILYAPRPATLREVAAAARSRGDGAFLVMAPEATPVAAAGLSCQLVARARGGVLGYVDTDLLRCALAPARAGGSKP